MGITPLDSIGLLGVALYLGSYAALQTGLLAGQRQSYALLNLLAASCVLLSLLEDFNASSAIIQISWITISLVGLSRFYFLSRKARFTPEEQALLSRTLPHLPKDQARRFLDRGRWDRVGPGTVLTRQGEPVSHLVYLAEGSADVLVDNRVIATRSTGSYIGEITCLDGSAATASAVTTTPARLFSIGANDLRALVNRNDGLRQGLDLSFARSIRHKLVLSTRDLATKRLRPSAETMACRAPIK